MNAPKLIFDTDTLESDFVNHAKTKLRLRFMITTNANYAMGRASVKSYADYNEILSGVWSNFGNEFWQDEAFREFYARFQYFYMKTICLYLQGKKNKLDQLTFWSVHIMYAMTNAVNNKLWEKNKF